MSRSVVTLTMIKAVEKAIKNADSYPTRRGLWKMIRDNDPYSLIPRDALTQIVDYLLKSNKIIIDRGEIVWVFVDNSKLKRLVLQSVRMR